MSLGSNSPDDKIIRVLYRNRKRRKNAYRESGTVHQQSYTAVVAGTTPKTTRAALLFLLDDPQLHVVEADAGVRGDLPV
jgi:hypothetical protein